MIRFALGRILITPGALDVCEKYNINYMPYLSRHAHGDWGDMDAEDIKTNNLALAYGGRLFSSYEIKDDCKIWIITESDHASTTILLPEEY